MSRGARAVGSETLEAVQSSPHRIVGRPSSLRQTGAENSDPVPWRRSDRVVYVAGVVADLVNPKVVLFFCASTIPGAGCPAEGNKRPWDRRVPGSFGRMARGWGAGGRHPV